MVVKKRKAKPLLILLIFLFILAICFFGGAIFWTLSTSCVDKNNDTSIEVVINSGDGTKKIAQTLKEKDLIKNEFIFKLYLKLYGKKTLKATTYEMNKTMNLEKIVKTLEKGNSYNPNQIKITFKEGQRITDYALEIAKNMNISSEEVLAVFNNQDFLKDLVDKYWFLDKKILNSNLYYPLEGYLAPDTYYFIKDSLDVEKIIITMLDEMESNLAKYKNKIKEDVHSYLTMASIVELEGTNEENKKMIVGIFNNRLKNKMNLGSDVTTYYALQLPMTNDLTTAQFNTSNPYNTRGPGMEGKLPLGPICNFSKESLKASVAPTNNDYLYFVADKKGKIYYTKSNSEHEQKVAEIKEKGDWIW